MLEVLEKTGATRSTKINLNFNFANVQGCVEINEISIDKLQNSVDNNRSLQKITANVAT